MSADVQFKDKGKTYPAKVFEILSIFLFPSSRLASASTLRSIVVVKPVKPPFLIGEVVAEGHLLEGALP